MSYPYNPYYGYRVPSQMPPGRMQMYQYPPNPPMAQSKESGNIGGQKQG